MCITLLLNSETKGVETVTSTVRLMGCAHSQKFHDLHQPYQVLTWFFPIQSMHKVDKLCKNYQIFISGHRSRVGKAFGTKNHHVRGRWFESQRRWCCKILLGIRNFAIRNNLWGRRRNLCDESAIMRLCPSALNPKKSSRWKSSTRNSKMPLLKSEGHRAQKVIKCHKFSLGQYKIVTL